MYNFNANQSAYVDERALVQIYIFGKPIEKWGRKVKCLTRKRNDRLTAQFLCGQSFFIDPFGSLNGTPPRRLPCFPIAPAPLAAELLIPCALCPTQGVPHFPHTSQCLFRRRRCFMRPHRADRPELSKRPSGPFGPDGRFFYMEQLFRFFSKQLYKNRLVVFQTNLNNNLLFSFYFVNL